MVHVEATGCVISLLQVCALCLCYPRFYPVPWEVSKSECSREKCFWYRAWENKDQIWRGIPYHVHGLKDNMVKMSVLPKSIYSSVLIPIKIPGRIFTDKFILKCMWMGMGLRIARTVRKNDMGGTPLKYYSFLQSSGGRLGAGSRAETRETPTQAANWFLTMCK